MLAMADPAVAAATIDASAAFLKNLMVSLSLLPVLD